MGSGRVPCDPERETAMARVLEHRGVDGQEGFDGRAVLAGPVHAAADIGGRCPHQAGVVAGLGQGDPAPVRAHNNVA